jgi:hypothetical protein
MPTLTLDAGADTESLLQFITRNVDDATLDQIEVQREIQTPDRLTTEPLTVSAALILATPLLVVTVGRIIERWLENRNQLAHLRIVAEGFTQSDEAGKCLADVSKAHAKVAVAYKLSTAPAKGR